MCWLKSEEIALVLRERWGRAWGRGEDSPGWRYGFREKRSALIFSFIFPELERFYRDTCGENIMRESKGNSNGRKQYTFIFRFPFGVQ
ncbi:hypothetical protein ACFXTN_003997 [Malus domestica]